MMFFDPMYLIFMIPGMLLAGWASMRVKSAFNKYSKVRSFSNMTGAQVARIILDRNGLSDVRVEQVSGFLSDHYDPSSRTLRLSPQVFTSPSIAAQGIAAHEAGHALQHKSGYAPLRLRTALVPVASIGSKLSWILITIGMFMAYSGMGMGMAKAGVLLFTAAVLFSIVTLPVEFNASSRAKKVLSEYGIIAPAEASGVAAVLDAAALTYVAAAITAMLQLLYFVMRLGLLGGND